MKEFAFNVLGAPFVAAIYILSFIFIYFIDDKDFLKKEKLKVLGWCLYAFFLYPIYVLHYILFLHQKEFTRKLKENFTEQIEATNN